jgi:serralysin
MSGRQRHDPRRRRARQPLRTGRNDVVEGQNGVDSIYLGPGTDTYRGGPGDDIFQFDPFGTVGFPDGADVVEGGSGADAVCLNDRTGPSR